MRRVFAVGAITSLLLLGAAAPAGAAPNCIGQELPALTRDLHSLGQVFVSPFTPVNKFVVGFAKARTDCG